jgi:2-dehydropantoate 2-reductase
MRILVVGAGAIGGYFGARLLAAGRDATFLVRPARADALAERGLSVRSRFGDLDLPNPPTVTAPALREHFDLVLLSCKAYDLDDAIESFAPAVGAHTTILPLLNGMAHLDALDRRFGQARTLGGSCVISSTLDSLGRVLHANDLHLVALGERAGGNSPRAQRVTDALSGAGFDVQRSDDIVQAMWEKWAFIATGASLTCLMRASVGDIVAAGGTGIALRLVDECAAIATAAGHSPSPASLARTRALLTSADSKFVASMQRDLESGARIEADHIVGDLLARAAGASPPPELLAIAYVHLKSYLARRARAQSTPS